VGIAAQNQMVAIINVRLELFIKEATTSTASVWRGLDQSELLDALNKCCGCRKSCNTPTKNIDTPFTHPKIPYRNAMAIFSNFDGRTSF